jgi:hypothetical protein
LSRRAERPARRARHRRVDIDVPPPTEPAPGSRPAPTPEQVPASSAAAAKLIDEILAEVVQTLSTECRNQTRCLRPARLPYCSACLARRLSAGSKRAVSRSTGAAHTGACTAPTSSPIATCAVDPATADRSNARARTGGAGSGRTWPAAICAARWCRAALHRTVSRTATRTRSAAALRTFAASSELARGEQRRKRWLRRGSRTVPEGVVSASTPHVRRNMAR